MGQVSGLWTFIDTCPRSIGALGKLAGWLLTMELNSSGSQEPRHTLCQAADNDNADQDYSRASKRANLWVKLAAVSLQMEESRQESGWLGLNLEL